MSKYVDVVLGYVIGNTTGTPSITNHPKLEIINAILKYDEEIVRIEKDEIKVL